MATDTRLQLALERAAEKDKKEAAFRQYSATSAAHTQAVKAQQDKKQAAQNLQSAQIASRLDTAPVSRDTQSAQIASRLDNKISSPSLNYAIGSWQGAFAADRLNNGSYAATGGIKQEEAAQKAKDLRVNNQSAQLAANLDNSLMGQATRDNQRASFERAMESLYNQMEVAKGANQMQDYTRAQQRYDAFADRLNELNNPTSTAAYAADWENRMRTEIMSTDDRVLMPKLERLLELADARMREASDRGDERRNGLTETEKQYNEIYNSLKNQYGDQVDGWIEYAKRMDNKAKMDERLEQTRQEAKDKKFGSSAKSVPLNMLSGAGYMDIVAQKMQRGITGSDAPIDYNSEAQSAAKMVNTIRSTVSEDMGATGQFLYNVGMSIADLIPSVVAGKISPSSAAAIGKATMALLGGSAATNAMQQAVERGASDDQALLIGMLSGALEAAMEKVPLEKLLSPTNTKTVKEIILNTLKQAGTEGVEEGLTTIANTLADALVMGNRSELQTNIRAITAAKLEANPSMSREAAEKAATKEAMGEWLINLGLDAASGVASGSAFGFTTSTADYINYKNSEAATPKLQPETQKQPPVADITPTPQQTQETPTPASVMPKLQQTETVPVAEFRQTAAEILSEGIFDSPTYGEALEQTGMKRADVRDALRAVARNNIAAASDPKVQVVLNVIRNVDAQPVQAQVKVPAQTTPEQTVSEVVSRMVGEPKGTAENANFVNEAPKIQDDIHEIEPDAKPAMGAADAGFSPYSAYQNTQSSFIPEGANAARPVDVPKVDPTGKQTRRFLSNAMGAQAINENTDARLQSDFMEGKYGYDIKGDPEAVRNAQNTLQNSPYDRFYGETLERLQSMKNLKQTVVDAQLLALEAQRKGNDADAAEILLLLAETGTEFGQAVQAYSIFRKLTPEGQLEGVRRTVKRLNEKIAKKGGKPKYSEADQAAIMDTVDDVRETALRLLKNIHETFSERDHGLEVENWIQEIGNQLATTMEKNKTPSPAKAQTVASTLRKDLQAFAKEYMDRNKSDVRYSSALALENFLNNREQYADAWNEARWKLQEKYADNPEMLDALHDFMANDISLEQLEKGIDQDISKALSQIGAKIYNIIRSNTADKASVANRVKDMLMKDHRLSDEDAQKMAGFILDRFNNMVAKSSQKALDTRFKPRDKKAKQTVMQRFSELANLGAFTNSNYRQVASERLFGEGVTVDEALAQKFRDAPDEKTRADVLEEIYQDIGSKLPTTLGEIANQWRYTAMLLNPSTHAKNIGSNTTQLVESTIKDAIATVGEGAVDLTSKLFRKGKGIQRTKAFLNLASKGDRQLLELAGNDYANARDEIMGVGKYQNTPEGKINQYKTTMKLNNPQNKVAKAVDSILRGAGKVADWNSDVMDVEDAWFSKPRYQAALAGYMKANGLNEITDEARKYAIKEAQKATYRDSNVVSDWARQLGNSRKRNWFTNSVDFVVNAIFPFKATPANVGVRAVEYSPVGLLTSIGKGVSSAIKGEFNAAAFIDDFSAGLTGTALAGVGLWLAQQGLLRAKGTGDDKEKEQMAAEGYEQNAVQLFGQSVPISAFGAASVPMLLGAAVYENFVANNPDDEGHPIDDFLDALGGTLDPVLETTMLTGLQDAVKSFQQYDPDAGLASGITKGVIDVVGDYVSTYIPTLLSRIANATDTAARQVYIDKNEDAQQFQGAAQTWQKKIPGLRNEMTEVVDAYGDTVEGGLPTEGDMFERVMKAVWSAVTPTYSSEIKTTPIDEEMRRLYRSDGVNDGDYTLFVPDAPKSFEVGNKTVYLTGDQYVEYQKNRNSSIQKIRGDIMNSVLYEKLPDDIRAAAMSAAYDYANSLAKAGLDVGYAIKDTWMKELAGATPEQVAETIIQRAINNAAEDKDRYENKYLGLETLLENKSIDDQMALACMSETCYNAYEQLKDTDISVQQFLDAYGNAYAGGENTQERRAAALEYIDTMEFDSPELEGTFTNAVLAAFPETMRLDSEVPEQHLLDIGDIGRIESQMSKEQREKYDVFVKDSSVDMQTYLDFRTFLGSEEAKAKKDEDGETIEGESKQDHAIAWLEELDVSDEIKGRLFCSEWARSSCPVKWRAGLPKMPKK